MLHVRRRHVLLGTIATFATARAAEVRLYTPLQPLAAAAALTLSDDQRRYLGTVMRFKVGDECLVFNGKDGEWLASVGVLDKKACQLTVLEQLRPQPKPSEAAPTLLFGVLKGARLPTLVEKATELGVGKLVPVVTRHCAARSLNVEKLQKTACEAAEQSRRLTVPEILAPLPLRDALQEWDPSQTLLLCDERGGAPPLSDVIAEVRNASNGAVGLLIGPEGGFAAEEFAAMDELPCVRRVSLGENTLRAETAARKSQPASNLCSFLGAQNVLKSLMGCLRHLTKSVIHPLLAVAACAVLACTMPQR